MRKGTPTDVFATSGVEIKNGDRVEVILPARSIYKSLLLSRGEVFFSHGSFKIQKEGGHISDTPRLDSYGPDCIINILEANQEKK